MSMSIVVRAGIIGLALTSARIGICEPAQVGHPLDARMRIGDTIGETNQFVPAESTNHFRLMEDARRDSGLTGIKASGPSENANRAVTGSTRKLGGTSKGSPISLDTPDGPVDGVLRTPPGDVGTSEQPSRSPAGSTQTGRTGVNTGTSTAPEAGSR